MNFWQCICAEDESKLDWNLNFSLLSHIIKDICFDTTHNMFFMDTW